MHHRCSNTSAAAPAASGSVMLKRQRRPWAWHSGCSSATVDPAFPGPSACSSMSVVIMSAWSGPLLLLSLSFLPGRQPRASLSRRPPSRYPRLLVSVTVRAPVAAAQLTSRRSSAGLGGALTQQAGARGCCG